MNGEDSTYSFSEESGDVLRSGLGVRVLAHPDTRRIGDFALLFEGARSGSLRLSRLKPDFRDASSALTGPLETGHLSRDPVELHWSHEGSVLRLKASESMAVEVNGDRLQGEAQFLLDEAAPGVVVLLGSHVVLWIGITEIVEEAPPVPGLVGESAVMRRLRQQIHEIAPTDMPVLLRGETGVGKEVVAASIHAHSLRAPSVYVAVNVAGIPPAMAASELFGHRRGAYTGATEDRPGYFVQANRGTLFLDEIGDISSEVQALLLRAIQEGVIQPLGGVARQVDVRLIAATDSDLESAIRRREFRAPLLHRFSFELRVPSLRTRLDDIGLLFFHLLGGHLHKIHKLDRIAPVTGRGEPWVPASFVAELARYSWPGNVRELSNVSLQFAVQNHDRERARVGPELKRLLAVPRPASQPAPLPIRGESPSDEEIAEAMRAAGFSAVRAAETLGISRANLYKRLESNPIVTRASDLSAAEIGEALTRTAGAAKEAASQLNVSPRALALRMKRLGLDGQKSED